MLERLTKNQYFINLANEAAKLGTCNRKKVGCVLVRNGHIISTGYNGSIPGADHCDDVGHDLAHNHCVRTQHAEANAVCAAAKLGHSTEGAIAYINTFPCWNCFKLLVSSGIEAIYYADDYKNDVRINQAITERIKNGKPLVKIEKLEAPANFGNILPISNIIDKVPKNSTEAIQDLKNIISNVLENLETQPGKEVVEKILNILVKK